MGSGGAGEREGKLSSGNVVGFPGSPEGSPEVCGYELKVRLVRTVVYPSSPPPHSAAQDSCEGGGRQRRCIVCKGIITVMSKKERHCGKSCVSKSRVSLCPLPCSAWKGLREKQKPKP